MLEVNRVQENETAVLTSAIAARQAAYAPYSGFKVGAALLGKSGRIYQGCNVENVAYGSSICAERTALVKAVSQGEREFVAIAIVADTKDPVAPCGACRQVLAEFAPHLKVVMANLKENKLIMTLDALLPAPFVKTDGGAE